MIYKNILCGPYLGDFAEEILTFRPYAQWIKTVLKPEKMCICSHSNRSFLYTDNFIPIFEDFSRDELNQNGLIHNECTIKELVIITKKIKSDIKTPDLLQFNTSYTKADAWYPLYKKIFNRVEIEPTKENYILFIPSMKEKYNVIIDIYNHLKNNYDNVIIAGDMKTHLHEHNTMFKNPSYFQDVYYDMVKLITNAKCVITPNSHWTIISLLQETPVFSWGENFKYFMNNNTSNQILTNQVTILNLTKIIDNFLLKIINNH